MTATRWSYSCEQLTEYYQPFNAFQAILPLAQLKLAPWRYYSKCFHHCKALKHTVSATKPLIFSAICLVAAIFFLRSSSILQTNILFSEQPFSRKSLLTPIAFDRCPKWSTPRLRCPFSNARSCYTEISASAASRSCVQPFFEAASADSVADLHFVITHIRSSFLLLRSGLGGGTGFCLQSSLR